MRPGSKKRSIIWNYFKKLDPNQAVCNICKKNIKSCGGTTNLKQHLIRIHPTVSLELFEPESDETLTPQEQAESEIRQIHEPSNIESSFPALVIVSPQSDPSNMPVQPADLPSIVPSTSSTTSSMASVKKIVKPPKQLKLFGSKEANKLSESKIDKINSKLIKMIVQDYQPLSVVENQGFLEYSNELEPRYIPPSRKHLTNEILPKYYNDAASSLRLILSQVKHVALTTDIWTSDSNRAYITVTCHFIYNDKCEARVLATKEMFGSHTADNIARELNEISTQWNIRNKIVTVVSDNGANIKKAVNDCFQKHHHPCVVHTLHLSITEAITSVDNLGFILKKCRSIVGHFKHSVVANGKLKSVQEQMNLPFLKVNQEVSTRWNSTFIMLERLLLIKDPLCVVVANLPSAPEFLDAEEWKTLEDCVKVLQPSNELTTVLSGEKYPTLSVVIPLLRGFQFTVRNLNTNTDIGQELKVRVLDTVTRRLFSLESNKIVAEACFLDPRFKKYGFGVDENADMAQKLVIEELTQAIMIKERENKEKESTVGEPMQQREQYQHLEQQRTGSIWSHFDKKISNIKSFTTPSTTATLMVRQYLEASPLERNKNPLEFWKGNKLIMPELYEIAIKYLCIPCTSVPSERVFSKAGQITNLRRSRLLPKHLDYIIFLNACI